MDKNAESYAQKILAELRLIANRFAHIGGIPLANAEHPQEDHDNTKDEKSEKVAVRETAGPSQVGSQVKPSVARHNDSSDEQQKAHPWLTKHKPAVEFAGLIGLLIYTFVTILLWCSSSKANGIIKENFITSQRPWVGPVLGKDNPFVIGDGSTDARWVIWLKNTGQSPALHTRIHMRGGVMSSPSLQSFADFRKDIENLSLEGVGVYTDTPILNGGEMPDSESIPNSAEYIPQARLAHPSVVFLLGGRISYEDQLGGPSHETTFCLVWVPPGSDGKDGFAGCPGADIAK